MSPTSCARRPSAERCCWLGAVVGDGLGELAVVGGVRVGARVHGGPAALHLDLTLASWAADGLLAIFFFVAGLELKREFVAGDLRDPRRAAVPVAAARRRRHRPGRRSTWLITLGAGGGAARAGRSRPPPTSRSRWRCSRSSAATCPTALRTFLLTLAVVDDLLAIVIIAVFYTATCRSLPLLAALVPLALFAVLVQRRVRSWWLLLPLAAATWALVHASGVHATVAGVLLGFAVPVIRSDRAGGPDAGPGLAEHFEHRFRPLSAGFAVPVFAFFSAGVTVGGLSRAGDRADRPRRGRHRRRPGRRQDRRHHGRHLAGRPVHPRPPRRGPGLDRRDRPVRPGRHRIHRLPADRRAGLRARHRTATTTSRSPSWPAPWSPHVLAAIVLRARDRAYRRLRANDLDNIPKPADLGPLAR